MPHLQIDLLDFGVSVKHGCYIKELNAARSVRMLTLVLGTARGQPPEQDQS